MGCGHAPIEGRLYASNHGLHQLQLSFVPPAPQGPEKLRTSVGAGARVGGVVDTNIDFAPCPPALYPSVYALMLDDARAPEDAAGNEDQVGVCESMDEVLEWALKPAEGLKWEGPPPSLPEPPHRNGQLASDVISRQIVDQLCSRFMQHELQDAADLGQVERKRKRKREGKGKSKGEGEGNGNEDGKSKSEGEDKDEGSVVDLAVPRFAPGSTLDPSILEGSMTDFQPHIR